MSMFRTSDSINFTDLYQTRRHWTHLAYVAFVHHEILLTAQHIINQCCLIANATQFVVRRVALT